MSVKKLSLVKETLQALNGPEAVGVHGGAGSLFDWTLSGGMVCATIARSVSYVGDCNGSGGSGGSGRGFSGGNLSIGTCLLLD